jgi:hypothetical protein
MKSHKRLMLLLALVLGALIAFGDSACESTTGPSSCKSDVQCDDGYDCVDGRCVLVIN